MSVIIINFLRVLMFTARMFAQTVPIDFTIKKKFVK